MEPAHANTEASVSGHCLDSSGKSMECLSKKEGIFLSQKENGILYSKSEKNGINGA